MLHFLNPDFTVDEGIDMDASTEELDDAVPNVSPDDLD